MWNASIEQIVDIVRLYGLRGIELWAQQFETRNYQVKDYTKVAEKYGINTIVHSKSWDLNFASMNKSIREASVEEIKKSIILAEVIRAKEVTVHPPRETLSGNKEYYYDIAYDSLKQICEFARAKGIRVSLEIMEKKPNELVSTDEELKVMVRDLYKEITYTVDVAHCRSEEEFWRYFNKVDNVSKIHISNKKGEKLHTKLSDGDFNFKDLIQKLLQYKIPLVIEGYDGEGDFGILKDNLEFIKKIGGIK